MSGRVLLSELGLEHFIECLYNYSLRLVTIYSLLNVFTHTA